ncbi:MAG: ribosome biogenesis GTPase Der [Nitrospinota bacterium]|nr:ribosome biogenesis GTPase Der [Nitrospinota bacterium]
MKTPVTAIIGRANVGKSTLFNKIIGKRSAIVNNRPGVTRDRNYSWADWFGRSFMVVDTGGADVGDYEIESAIKEQTQFALEEADAVIFVVDGRQGMTPQDRELIQVVRKSTKPMFLAINKIDEPKHDVLVHEFSQLGIENYYPVSAEHGNGVLELLEKLVKSLPSDSPSEEAQDEIKIAIIGRPNVGKSSLVNSLLKSPRSIVTAQAGTTRDSIDSHLTYEDICYLLVDTAGMRRKGKTVALLDKYSVIMALKAVDRCDIALVVIDGQEGITDQDATIAGYAYEKGCGCILVVNKWDLAKRAKRSFREFKEKVKNKTKFLDFAPIFAVSAKTGYNLDKILPKVCEVYREYSRELTTVKVNDCFERAVKRNPMSSYRGKLLKLFYSTQVRNCPPTFRCFVNYPQGIHFSYKRYLTNSLRKTFGLAGTPVRLIFSKRNERSRIHGTG